MQMAMFPGACVDFMNVDASASRTRSLAPRRLAAAAMSVRQRAALSVFAGKTLPTYAASAAKRIRKDCQRIARVPDLATLEAHERHRVRIHAKRLRYALEFFRSVRSRRTREETAKLPGERQRVLGDANDAAVAADRLTSMPEAGDYRRGFARAWSAASATSDAEEGERLLRAMHRPRIRASI
jgi:CHAD domain-containing protein